MKRLVLAACLSVPSLACGQTGVEITTGAGNIGNVTLIGITIGTDPLPVVFEPVIFTIPPMPREPIGKAMMAGLNPSPAIPYALDPGAMLHGQAPIVTIEEEGIRLPDEQFSLP